MTDEPSTGDADELPLAALAATVEAADSSTLGASRFDEPTLDPIDEARLWAALERGVSHEQLSSDDAVCVIDAAKHCHQCEHFATPPAMACTLTETEILEVVSMGQFRVRNCPVVDER